MPSPPNPTTIQDAARSASQPLTMADGPDLTRYLLICSLLILAIALLGWGFRRFLGGTLASRAARRSLRVVDSLPMGGRRRLAVVRCYDRTFLLGVGDRELNLVAELDEEHAALAAPRPNGNARGTASGSGSESDGESFGAALGRALGGDQPVGGSSSRAAGILAALKRGEGVLG